MSDSHQPHPNETSIDSSEETRVEDDRRMMARWRPLVFALMTLALLLRIAAAFLVERQANSMGQSFLIEGDANGYWELGQKIATGEEYALYTPPRQVERVPGFPFLIAGSIRLFGDKVIAARIALAFVGTACCWLTYRMGSVLHTRRVGFWAAMFVAIHPLHIGNSVLILSETWFTFRMLLSLLGLIWLIDGHQTCRAKSEKLCHWRLSEKAAIVGALTGAATLIRPGFLPWLGISCAAVFLLLRMPGNVETNDTTEQMPQNSPPRAPLHTRLMVCVALVLGCGVTMLPWAARNASVTGHWVFTSLWSGPSLYDGLNPEATGASDMQFFEDDFVMQHMSEFEMNQHYKQKAIDYATQNPGHTASLALRKAAFFLSPVPNFARKRGWAASAACAVLWLFLLVASLTGLRLREWDGTGLLVMVGPLILFLLVHMVFVGSVRYRLPLEFPLSVLGAIGWRSLVLTRGQSSHSSSGETLTDQTS